jgi:ATP-dependent Clp protease adaptor protein ClpS
MSMRPYLSTSLEDHRPSLLKYHVVLHRGAWQALMDVVRVVRDLTRFAEAEAMLRMWQAYHSGRASLVITHLERGELLVEQLTARGLHATLEPTS